MVKTKRKTWGVTDVTSEVFVNKLEMMEWLNIKSDAGWKRFKETCDFKIVSLTKFNDIAKREDWIDYLMKKYNAIP